MERIDAGLMRSSVRRALADNLSYEDVVNKGLSRGIIALGSRFDRGEVFLPQLLVAAKLMDEALDTLEPLCSGEDRFCNGTVVMGTVSGDIHEIGKNVCCAMLRAAGYRVIDLGSDVSPEEFVKASKEYEADVIGGSALMTTTLLNQKRVMMAVREEGSTALCIFGGAPCTPEWVESIGADGYSASGSEIVALVARLLERTP